MINLIFLFNSFVPMEIWNEICEVLSTPCLLLEPKVTTGKWARYSDQYKSSVLQNLCGGTVLMYLLG